MRSTFLIRQKHPTEHIIFSGRETAEYICFFASRFDIILTKQGYFFTAVTPGQIKHRGENMFRKICVLMMAAAFLFTSYSFAESNDEERQPVSVNILENIDDLDISEEGIGDPFIPETGEEEKAIIEADNRTTITKPSQYPYSAIAYIEAEATCGCPWTGTGFMISSRWMLTAGHCMYCTDHLKPVKYVKFYFGYKNARNYLLCQDAGCTIWVSNYVKEGSGYSSDDYAYIRFDKKIGDTVGWFGYWYGAPDNKVDNHVFYCAGYRDGILKSDYDWVNVISEKRISHTIDTLPGNSGAPIFDDDYYVVAIHTAHAHDESENYGVRFTNQLYRFMQSAGFPD